jgi:hypothetical protein
MIEAGNTGAPTIQRQLSRALLNARSTRLELMSPKPGAYSRSHFRSTVANFAHFRSSEAYSVPHETQTNPWMCPEGAQVEL